CIMRERLTVKRIRTIEVGRSETALGPVKLVLCPKEEVVRFRILRLCGGQGVQFTWREVRFESLGNFFCDFALNREEVLQLTLIAIRPELSIRPRIDQLHIRADFFARSLHFSFKDGCNATLARARLKMVGPARVL